MDRVLLGLAYKFIYPWIRHKLQPQQQGHVINYSEKDQALLNLKMKEGAVVVIVGSRGTGKTELAYRLAEFIDKPIYAISPEQVPHPSSIELIGFEEIDEKVMPKSTVIFDDVPVYLSNRDYHDQLCKSSNMYEDYPLLS